ncbi:reverse transcriptase domain-containing protein [Tanacetum coccineum]
MTIAKGNLRNGDNNYNGNGCICMEFLACKPKEFDGKGGALTYTRWVEKMESVRDISNCAANQRVKYATCSLVGKALIWWNTYIQPRGREAVVGMAWVDFKTLLKEEYCPNNEMKKLENEFWNHTMVGPGHAAYTDRFHELAKLVPHLVTPESKRIERYIYGLVPQVCGMVAATEPSTIQSSILKAEALTYDMVRNGTFSRSGDKRKDGCELGKQGDTRNDNKRAKAGKGYMTAGLIKKGYTCPAPMCTN